MQAAYHSISYSASFDGNRGDLAMRTKGSNGVGRVSVDLEIANNDDLALVRRGMLPDDQVRREVIRGVVDSGAAMLVLPQAAVKRLGLPLGNDVTVRYADGRRATRREAKGVSVTLAGREDTFSAVVEPKRTDALIGAIVLEALDLLVDCKNQRVVPRDPDGAFYEIE
jgi:predicted aspartyl protease